MAKVAVEVRMEKRVQMEVEVELEVAELAAAVVAIHSDSGWSAAVGRQRLVGSGESTAVSRQRLVGSGICLRREGKIYGGSSLKTSHRICNRSFPKRKFREASIHPSITR